MGNLKNYRQGRFSSTLGRQPQGGILLVLNLRLEYVFFEYRPQFTDNPRIAG